MANKKHLYLRNETGVSTRFNRSRGIENTDESTEERDYSQQRSRLSEDLNLLTAERDNRILKRDNNLNIAHLESIIIDFLTMIDDGFAKQLELKFGISALHYSNFNQTVWFAISDYRRFEQNFVNGIRRFAESNNNHSLTPEEKIITTIQDFRFVTSSQIRYGIEPNILSENIIIKIHEDNISIGEQQRSIKTGLNEYLRDRNIVKEEISSNIFQIKNITPADLEYILNNFDIVQSVQGLRYLRVVPGEFGEEVLGIGLNIELAPNAPTIAILDTGVSDDPMLRPILSENGKDITSDNEQPYLIDSDHGTTVATLASFGDQYFNSSENTIIADAKIFSIKIQAGEEGCINLKGIQDAIRYANREFGIRLFNLSMSAGGKNYNSDISTYAYILDRLSYELDILIFISAGNLDNADIHEIVAKHRRRDTDARIRSFLSSPNHYFNPFITLDEAEVHVCECINLSEPAESMNNITVGALADNLDGTDVHHGLSLGKQYPAYYTRKYYVDYTAKINNTPFKKNQTNKNLFKPDIVMPGGDAISTDAKMKIIGINNGHPDYIYGAGTSYAAPLAANLAAKILSAYPVIKAQTIKAILINSAQEINPSYLSHTVENLKSEANPQYPDVDRSEKSRLSRIYDDRYLSHTISGHGKPSIERCLYSDDKRVTFIIEDHIQFDTHKVINLNIPDYLTRHPNRNKALILTGTLCYNFDPQLRDSMSYLPLHISFNFGNSMNHDDAARNAIEYSVTTATDNNDRMAIKKNFRPWSDDFFPANTKRFSNVQKMSIILTAEEIRKVSKQISIIFRCTGRDSDHYAYLRRRNHDFSFVLTVEEVNSDALSQFSLYDELTACNIVENIADLATEIELDN